MKKSMCTFIGLIGFALPCLAGDITDVQCVALKQKIEDLRCDAHSTGSNYSDSCTENDAKKMKAMKLFEKNACYDRIYKLLDQQLDGTQPLVTSPSPPQSPAQIKK